MATSREITDAACNFLRLIHESSNEALDGANSKLMAWATASDQPNSCEPLVGVITAIEAELNRRFCDGTWDYNADNNAEVVEEQ